MTWRIVRDDGLNATVRTNLYEKHWVPKERQVIRAYTEGMRS